MLTSRDCACALCVCVCVCVCVCALCVCVCVCVPAGAIADLFLLPALVRVLPRDPSAIGPILRTLFVHSKVIEQVRTPSVCVCVCECVCVPVWFLCICAV